MKKLIIPVLFVSVILALGGCGNRGQGVLAKIGDRVITLEEFDKKIERLPKQYQEILKGQKKKFLDEIIKEELLHKEALKSKIDKDPETQEVITEAKKRILVARLIKNRVQDKAFISEEELGGENDTTGVVPVIEDTISGLNTIKIKTNELENFSNSEGKLVPNPY